MNGKRLRVSARDELNETVFATGMPFAGRKYLPDTLKELAHLMPQCAGVRRWGAASLDLAYVAAGRYDGFWERELQPWDIAAGLLLVKEAGGIVEGMTTDENPLESGGVITSNEPIFNRFSKIIRNEG